MRRILIAALASAALGVSVGAQAPQAPAAARGATPAAQDMSAIQIKTTKIAPNFYTLEGSGGVIGVLPGTDGVFMVDAQYAQLTEKIAAAIKAISDKPIRLLVNTHQHPDHTGGNENFAKMGVTIISRDELRAGLLKNAATPAMALPLVTYEGSVVVHMNGEDVRLIPVPKAHTDGDTMVYFPKNDVIMSGDFYRSLGYPNIDRANGGSLEGMLKGLSALADLAGPSTRIVPGHGAIVDRTAVLAHRDMMLAVRDKVAALVKQGKTLAEVVAAKPTAAFDAKIPTAETTSERFVGQLYAELGGK